MHECSATGMAALRTETQTAKKVPLFCFDECICEAALPLLVRPCKAPSSKGHPMI